MPDRDRKLLSDFLRGEASAHERCAEWARSVLFSRRLSIPADEREDLLQETLQDLFTRASRPDFQLRESLSGLVKTIAAARCVDWWRRVGRVRDRDRRMASRGESPPPLHDEQVLDHLDGARAWRAVDAMDPACRRLIRRRLIDDYDYEAISRMTGVKVPTLRSRFYECMRKLRWRLRRGS